jgi:small-conductance mechanosensitive channel
MDTQQEIYQKLFRAFKKEGIGFAYPTQLVYTKSGATSSVETEVVPPPQITK